MSQGYVLCTSRPSVLGFIAPLVHIQSSGFHLFPWMLLSYRILSVFLSMWLWPTEFSTNSFGWNPTRSPCQPHLRPISRHACLHLNQRTCCTYLTFNSLIHWNQMYINFFLLKSVPCLETGHNLFFPCIEFLITRIHFCPWGKKFSLFLNPSQLMEKHFLALHWDIIFMQRSAEILRVQSVELLEPECTCASTS